MESQIDPHDGVEDHDEDFHEEVEGVETRFGVIPCRLVARTWREVVRTRAEGGAQGEQNGRQE